MLTAHLRQTLVTNGGHPVDEPSPGGVRATSAARYLAGVTVGPDSGGQSARWSRLALAAVLLTCQLQPDIALAHAFGPRYDLPLPLWLFLLAAGTAVGLSFVVMVAFARRHSAGGEALHVKIGSSGVVDGLAVRAFKLVAQALAASLFIVVIVTGLFGNPDMLTNFSTVFVWIVWWTGMVFVQALIGDVWSVLNPWRIFYDATDSILRRAGRALRLQPRFTYPRWLSYWPAVMLFLVFAWLENVSMAATQPSTLAMLIITYSIITWTGMAVFGRDIWLRHGEVFSVVFGLIARFGPVGSAQRSTYTGWELRPYATGLLTREPVPLSLVFLIVTLLATVSFDGFEETREWVELQEAILTSQWLKPYRPSLLREGVEIRAIIKTCGLVAAAGVFFLAFAVVAALADRMGGKHLMARNAIFFFVLTLLPIAIGYHIAHYLSYFLIAGQVIIPLASDPFGYGWDLFGTATYELNVGIVDAKTVWYTAVVAIVVGHIAAVYLAHVMAVRVFEGPGAAIRSQIPMVVLMVGYTITSLWILAQPIVLS